jgi:6-phosphogluconolactonase
MAIRIFKTIHELLEAMAVYFITTANNAISLHGEFNVVLSGGNSPQLLYSMLASLDFKNQTNWEKINFFFGDERHVPSEDPRNNALMVTKVLFEPLHISASKIFSINTTLSPNEAANEYAKKITTHFKGHKAQFDLVLLGLGENAHTASLFPYTPVLADKSASIKTVHHVLEDEPDLEKYPAQLIHPNHDNLHWYLDEAAASGLKKKFKTE